MKTLVKAHISRTALRHNVRLLMKRTGRIPLCAMIKANAYGHGADIVAQALSGMGISFWGVACVEEAMRLMDLKVPEPVLIVQPLGEYDEDSVRERADWMINHEVRATIAGKRGLAILAERAAVSNKKAYIHVKVDTGMRRNGCLPEHAEELLLEAIRTPGIILEGMYSHFACADEADLQFAREQFNVFRSVIQRLEAGGVEIPIKHMANSAAIFNFPDAFLDMVRPGIALYGYQGAHSAGSEKLLPVLSLVAPILLTKMIKKGESCGYGATFIASRNTRAGLLPMGYADGYSRRLSNAGIVDVNGRLVPVIGRISMDFTIIDLTDVPDAIPGTEVCIISNRREAPNSVESLAKQLGTIPHEIVSVFGSRVRRFLSE